VSVVINGSFKNEDQSEKLIRLLEEQLAHANEQNKALSQKLDQALDQIEFLNQQLQHLTKLLYGSKPEKSKYITPDGQGSLFEDEHPSSFSDSEHTEEQSQQEISYTVVRKLHNKKGAVSKSEKYFLVLYSPFYFGIEFMLRKNPPKAVRRGKTSADNTNP
jgi:predicted RNase H-like nuclease (RuvC/YqgF family)